MSDRTCTHCGNTHPLTKDFFRWRERDGKSFFTPECRNCIAAQKKETAERIKKRRRDSLKKIEAAGVDLYVQSAQAGGSNIPHSAEVIERVFQYFGGVGGFSAMLVKQYYDSPPGSSARNRLLETLCRLVSKNVEQGGAKKPLTLWSEEELELELNDRFQQAVAAFKGTTIDVQGTKKAPQALTADYPDAADDDEVRAGHHPPASKRTPRKKARSPQALPPEPEPSGDT